MPQQMQCSQRKLTAFWLTSKVHMLNWQLNEDAVADTYTGYLVEYEIGSGFYVLLDLIEYDKEERYTCEIVYSGDSLTELHQCYE